MKDISLNRLSYQAFGKLRFLDFFPKTKSYREDCSGGLEAGIGLSCCEGYGPACLFVSPADAFGKTCEIGMDFDNGCPENEGHSLLERLGIPVHKGMTRPKIEAILGNPVQRGRYFMDYAVGKEWKYDVSLIFGPEGLSRVIISRQDMADAQRATGR